MNPAYPHLRYEPNSIGSASVCRCGTTAPLLNAESWGSGCRAAMEERLAEVEAERDAATAALTALRTYLTRSVADEIDVHECWDILHNLVPEDLARVLKWVDEIDGRPKGAQGADVARGIYVASRASGQERPAMWLAFRSEGFPIVSSWIDEVGSGETLSFRDLWTRILAETMVPALVLYAPPQDSPWKGAFIEAGMVLGRGGRVFIACDGSHQHLGSWVWTPGVTICADVRDALRAAQAFVEAGGTTHLLRLAAESRRVAAERDAARDEARRLRDLVRYQRGALFDAELITEAEYAALTSDAGAVARLQGYDEVRRELAEATDPDNRHRAMLDWRGVSVPCPRCTGSGQCLYGSTATWRGGIGGQAMTWDVCDACWGSGDAERQGADLRVLHAHAASAHKAVAAAVEARAVELDAKASAALATSDEARAEGDYERADVEHARGTAFQAAARIVRGAP